jgi:hypothetical protein
MTDIPEKIKPQPWRKTAHFATERKKINMNWIPSKTDFATIIDADSGKQIADFCSPYLSEEESLRNFRLGLALPSMLHALTRAEFLMRRVSEGDHQALDNLADAAAQCHEVLAKATGQFQFAGVLEPAVDVTATEVKQQGEEKAR